MDDIDKLSCKEELLDLSDNDITDDQKEVDEKPKKKKRRRREIDMIKLSDEDDSDEETCPKKVHRRLSGGHSPAAHREPRTCVLKVTVRPSYAQTEKLVNFLEKNPILAQGHLRSAQARYETKKKWNEVTAVLNYCGEARKDAKGWAKFWADKKYALKKVVAYREANVASGGVDKLLPLSKLEKRMIALLGDHPGVSAEVELQPPETEDDPLSLRVSSPPFLKIRPIKVEPICPSPPKRRSPSPKPKTPPPAKAPRTTRMSARRMARSQLDLDRQRLAAIEEKRVQAELASSAGWAQAVEAINNLANAIIVTGDKIAKALQNR